MDLAHILLPVSLKDQPPPSSRKSTVSKRRRNCVSVLGWEGRCGQTGWGTQTLIICYEAACASPPVGRGDQHQVNGPGRRAAAGALGKSGACLRGAAWASCSCRYDVCPRETRSLEECMMWVDGLPSPKHVAGERIYFIPASYSVLGGPLALHKQQVPSLSPSWGRPGLPSQWPNQLLSPAHAGV